MSRGPDGPGRGGGGVGRGKNDTIGFGGLSLFLVHWPSRALLRTELREEERNVLFNDGLSTFY